MRRRSRAQVEALRPQEEVLPLSRSHQQRGSSSVTFERKEARRKSQSGQRRKETDQVIEALLSQFYFLGQFFTRINTG